MLYSYFSPHAKSWSAQVYPGTPTFSLQPENYEIKQAFKNLPDAGRPDNETVACHEYRQCEGCNYPAHGFICWHGDGKCLRTEMREVKK